MFDDEGEEGGQKRRQKFVRQRKVCEKCGRSFAKVETLRNHLLKVHNFVLKVKSRDETKHEQKYMCTLCGNRYTTKYSLYLHMQSVHGEDKPDRVTKHPKRFPCRICGKGYTHRVPLYHHQLTKHGIQKTPFVPKHPRKFICDVCSLGVIDRRGLRRHKKMVHGIDENPKDETYECYFCDRVFKREKCYERHLSVCKQTSDQS